MGPREAQTADPLSVYDIVRLDEPRYCAKPIHVLPTASPKGTECNGTGRKNLNLLKPKI
jgi:hypothetical protein